MSVPKRPQRPIPIRINCPTCGLLHVDRGLFATKPHHTHSCQGCGMTWRPAVVDTVGVQFLPGFKDEEESGVVGASRAFAIDLDRVLKAGAP